MLLARRLLVAAQTRRSASSSVDALIRQMRSERDIGEVDDDATCAVPPEGARTPAELDVDATLDAGRAASAAARGRAFELLARDVLARSRMDLEWTGQANDRGIDLVGEWRVDADSRVRVVAQCKNETRHVEPRHLRELEGVLVHQGKDTLGLLVAATRHSPHALRQLHRAVHPMALVRIDIASRALHGFRLNSAAQELLPHVSVGRTFDPETGARGVRLLTH